MRTCWRRSLDLIMARFFLLWMLGVLFTSGAATASADDTATSAPTRPWSQTLCLGNEGYWRQRLQIVVRNDADGALAGSPVEVIVGTGGGQADLKDASADALRLVNEAGAELLWALTSPAGQPVKRGPIPAGSVLTLSAECPAHDRATYSLYFDNPDAWAVPDFLDLHAPPRKEDPKTSPGVNVQAGVPERLKGFREVGADAPWPADASGADWEYRLPIHVLNLTSQALGNGLISVDLSGPLAKYQRSVNPDAVRVMDGQKTVESYRLGALLMFEGWAEPLTRRTFHVYFRGIGNSPKAPATSAAEYAANPALPGGQTQQADPAISRADYARLLNSTSNLARNPSFETGDKVPEHWFGGADNERPAGVQMGFDEPGLFGGRCLRMTFPANADPQWVGWRQDVPVQPGRAYLFAAWLKCQDLVGSLQIHAHYRNARGELCREQQMTSAGPEIHGTTDWTLLHGLFSMPQDIATFQLHLTMLAKGTVWHDGVMVTEVTPGSLGRMGAKAESTLSEPVAWPVNAIVKVFQDDVPPSARGPARITAARNDREPLQLALRSPRALQKVKVTVQAPANVNGERLTDISVGVVGYVPVDHPTSYYSSTTPTWYRKVPSGPGRSDGWPGWWPDPILPRDTFDLPAHVTQPVWITNSVPKGAASGDYTGTVRFVTAETSLIEVPFTVHVWDFTLPDTMHVKAIYDCRQDGSRWAVPGKTPDQSRREFWRFMAQRRLCPDTIRPEPILRFENGKVVSDFAAFDEAGEFYFNTLKLPHAYTPWLFYGFGWGHPPSERFGEQPYEGNPPFESADRAKLRPEFKRAYQACLKTFWEHLRAKGWSDKFVLYISDEPFDAGKPIRDQMKALCDMIHEVDRSIPIYCSTWHHQPAWDGCLDVWGLGHYGVVPVDKLRQIREGGAHLWWTTDGHMCIDTPYCAVERLLPHYCFKYGAEAYEFWGVDWLTYNPYEFGWHSYIHQSEQPGKFYYVRYPNGDGYLAYPGAPIGHDGPVSSVRLEQAREGCEDYEYMYLLREAIASAKQTGRDTFVAEQALAGAQELVTIPNAGGLQSTRVLPNPDAVLEVKERVARAIESLH